MEVPPSCIADDSRIALYLSRFAAMSFHSFWNMKLLPVKWDAAKLGCDIAYVTTSGGDPGINWKKSKSYESFINQLSPR